MAKSSPPPRPQLRAGDVVVLRKGPEYVEGEIITVLGDSRYKVRWLTGSDYQNRVTTVTTEEVRKKS
jgi:signal peptidase I